MFNAKNLLTDAIAINTLEISSVTQAHEDEYNNAISKKRR